MTMAQQEAGKALVAQRAVGDPGSITSGGGVTGVASRDSGASGTAS